MTRFSWGAGLCALAAGCADGGPSVELAFPDGRTREVTSALAVTVVEPLLEVEGEPTRLLGCDRIGGFADADGIPVAELGSPGIGRLISSRELFAAESGFSHRLGLPELEPSERNPWGALAVVVEARGDVIDVHQALRSGTLGQACFCVRTAEGTHRDAALDAEVKAACRPLDELSKVELRSPVGEGFDLRYCGTDRITGPVGEVARPGASACIRPIPCRPGVAGPCVQCEGQCTNRLGGAPVRFDVAGGGLAPRALVALSENDGRAEAPIGLTGCSGEFEVTAEVLGTEMPPLRFVGRCVDPVSAVECGGEKALEGTSSVVGLERLLAPVGGQPDRVAVLSGNTGTVVEVHDPQQAAPLATYRIPGETSRSILSFDAAGPGEPRRPMLAVASSRSRRLFIRLLEWDGIRLTATATLAAPCSEWSCGTLDDCAEGQRCEDGERCSPSSGRCELEGPGTGCSDAPPGCGCELVVDFGAAVSLATGDVDGDGRADLAAATSSGNGVTVWLSSRRQDGSPLSDGQCRCGRYGHQPENVVLAAFGGTEGAPTDEDLVIAGASGTFVTYGDRIGGEVHFRCGAARRFGEIIPVRDLAVGRFSCNPTLEPGCEPYEDLVVLSNLRQDGSSFDDPGRLRVIFGGARNVADVDDIYAVPRATVELTPIVGSNNPGRAVVGDINGDGHDDLTVLFSTSQLIRIWLGGSNRALGETDAFASVSECATAFEPEEPCRPLDVHALPDLDGDGRAEMVVVCRPMQQQPRLRWFRARP